MSKMSAVKYYLSIKHYVLCNDYSNFKTDNSELFPRISSQHKQNTTNVIYKTYIEKKKYARMGSHPKNLH